LRRNCFLALALAAALLSACGTTPVPPILASQVVEATSTGPPPTETPLPPEPLTGCVVGGNLRVRSEPNTHSDILGGLMVGQCVTVHGTNADRTWGSMTADELAGWVSLQYVQVRGDVAAIPITGDFSGTTAVQTLATPTALPAQAGTLNCTDTYPHIGEFVSCAIPQAYCTYHPETEGHPTVCNDPPYPDHEFTLRAWESDWSDLDGRCIIVNGLVEYYRGKPQIVPASRSQVSLCP